MYILQYWHFVWLLRVSYFIIHLVLFMCVPVYVYLPQLSRIFFFLGWTKRPESPSIGGWLSVQSVTYHAYGDGSFERRSWSRRTQIQLGTKKVWMTKTSNVCTIYLVGCKSTPVISKTFYGQTLIDKLIPSLITPRGQNLTLTRASEVLILDLIAYHCYHSCVYKAYNNSY